MRWLTSPTGCVHDNVWACAAARWPSVAISLRSQATRRIVSASARGSGSSHHSGPAQMGRPSAPMAIAVGVAGIR